MTAINRIGELVEQARKRRFELRPEGITCIACGATSTGAQLTSLGWRYHLTHDRSCRVGRRLASLPIVRPVGYEPLPTDDRKLVKHR